jgi:hypothetical protein
MIANIMVNMIGKMTGNMIICVFFNKLYWDMLGKYDWEYDYMKI